MEFTEKQVIAADTPLSVQHKPRHLRELGSVTVAVPYDPPIVQTLYEQMGVTQEIVVYPPPLWIMSPGMKVYRAKDIVRFKGYLDRFEPVNIPNENEYEPEVHLTIRVTG